MWAEPDNGIRNHAPCGWAATQAVPASTLCIWTSVGRERVEYQKRRPMYAGERKEFCTLRPNGRARKGVLAKMPYIRRIRYRVSEVMPFIAWPCHITPYMTTYGGRKGANYLAPIVGQNREIQEVPAIWARKRFSYHIPHGIIRSIT